MLAPRIYLDFDGVVNAHEPQHAVVRRFSIPIEGSQHLQPVEHIVFSPTVVQKLDELRTVYGLELVWLTTWNEWNHILKLSDSLEGLHGGRVLPAALNPDAVDKMEWTQWKANAILADQKASPAPFVWVDDNAHRYHGAAVETAVKVSSLLLTPNSAWGLTVEDLNQIENFLREAA